MSQRAPYLRVFGTFLANSLVRDMTYRANFLIESITSLTWMLMNLGFYLLVFEYTRDIGGWDRNQFFVFIATSIIINSVVQAFFMPNAEEFSELVRGGGLDFALLKPIDTQFLISLRRIEWSPLGQIFVAMALAGYALSKMEFFPSPIQIALYFLYVGCGVAILYSLIITLAAVSVWMGRNQSIYDFWFYITNFSRYPMEIYRGEYGDPLRLAFTYLIPILIVVNVPARLLTRPLSVEEWRLSLFAICATVAALAVSRWTFIRALASYRSASS